MPFFKYSDPKGPDSIKYEGDCMIRSVVHATGAEYDTVYQIMKRYGWRTSGKYKYAEGAKKWEDLITLTLKELGYKVNRVSCPAQKGQPRHYAHDVAGENNFKGTQIIRVAKHVATIKDGTLLDVWNCSHKCVYFYWVVYQLPPL